MANRYDMNNRPPFGARLVTFRKSKKMTQIEFGKKLGLSRGMILYYEKRAKNPSSEFIQKVVDTFGISADQLLNGKAKRTAKSGPKSELEWKIEQVRELPRAKQKLILGVIDSVLQSEVVSN